MCQSQCDGDCLHESILLKTFVSENLEKDANALIIFTIDLQLTLILDYRLNINASRNGNTTLNFMFKVSLGNYWRKKYPMYFLTNDKLDVCAIKRTFFQVNIVLLF